MPRGKQGPPVPRGLHQTATGRWGRGWLAQGLPPRSCREGPGYTRTADSVPSFLAQAAAGHWPPLRVEARVPGGQARRWVMCSSRLLHCSQIDVYLAKSLAEKLYLFQVITGPEGKGGGRRRRWVAEALVVGGNRGGPASRGLAARSSSPSWVR